MGDRKLRSGEKNRCSQDSFTARTLVDQAEEDRMVETLCLFSSVMDRGVLA